jgi:hypothetical protein
VQLGPLGVDVLRHRCMHKQSNQIRSRQLGVPAIYIAPPINRSEQSSTSLQKELKRNAVLC